MEEKDGKCTLNYSKGKVSNQLTLDIAPNCKLIKWGASNKIRVHYYKDIKATVFMIGGEIHKGDCKEETAKTTQTILVSQNSIKLGSQRNRTCLPDGPDEKEYWISSH